MNDWDKEEGQLGKGCLIGTCIALAMWAVIIALGARWWEARHAKAPVKDASVVSCERSNPPWALAERCRR